MIALSVELQRTNSRMILQRSPQSGNLIEKDIVKCQQSIAIKKKEAVECLRLLSLKPTRVMKWKKTEPCERKIKISSGQVSTVEKTSVCKKRILKRQPSTSQKLLRRRRQVRNGKRSAEVKATKTNSPSAPRSPR